MTHTFKISKPVMMVAMLLTSLIASAFSFKEEEIFEQTNNFHLVSDTIPSPVKHQNSDLSSMSKSDEQSKKLDVQLAQLDEQLNGLDLQMAQLDEQLNGLDTIIDNQVKNAISKADIENALKQAEASIKGISFNEISRQTSAALRQAGEEIRKIDFTELKNDLKKAKEELNSEKLKEHINFKELNNDIKEAMQNAKTEFEKAKQELQQTKDFTNVLEKDGLIKKNKQYTIDWKDNGDLYINGFKQSQQTADRYHKYFKKGGYTIKNDEDDDSEEAK